MKRFIEKLERNGQLQCISTYVNPEEEIAEITDRVVKGEGENSRALLFTNTGTQFPVLMNLFGNEKRCSMALNVEHLSDIRTSLERIIQNATAPKSSLYDMLKMLPLLGQASKWFPRKKKSRGLCQKNILLGKEAHLDILPILKCWEYDGGRFITLPMVNTLDPVSGQRNVGMYRMQVFDNYTTGMHWHKHKTGARHYEEYKKLGRIMPVTVCLGGDPSYTYSATAPLPENVDEYLLAGFLRKKPVVLTKCLTNDLWIPEDCDIVIEGYVDPKEDLAVEGDFGDHTGFYSLKDLYPKFHISAITYKDNAVYPATIVGIPPQEDAWISRATETLFLTPIKFALYNEVEDLSMPEMGTSHNLSIVKINPRYEGQALKVANGLWNSGQMMFNKYMLVTGPDCDIRSIENISRLIRNCSPQKDSFRSKGIYDVLDHATATNGIGGKFGLDLTRTSTEDKKFFIKETFRQEGRILDNHALEGWGVICIYTNKDTSTQINEILRGIETNAIAVAIFDTQCNILKDKELLWIATANTDPERDLRIEGSTIILDCRVKRGKQWNEPKRFPNIVTSSCNTINMVNERWSEYGFQEFIESPSKRYRELLLSSKAEI